MCAWMAARAFLPGEGKACAAPAMYRSLSRARVWREAEAALLVDQRLVKLPLLLFRLLLLLLPLMLPTPRLPLALELTPLYREEEEEEEDEVVVRILSSPLLS